MARIAWNALFWATDDSYVEAMGEQAMRRHTGPKHTHYDLIAKHGPAHGIPTATSSVMRFPVDVTQGSATVAFAEALKAAGVPGPYEIDLAHPSIGPLATPRQLRKRSCAKL